MYRGQLDQLWEPHLDGLRPSNNGHGPILQKGADKCAIYLQTAVVVDEALLLERIHKFTYSCAGGTNHLREGCLAHFQGGSPALIPWLFAQTTTKPVPVAKIEELICQVFLDSNNSGKQIRIKQCSKLRVALERAKRPLLLQASDTGGPN